MYSSEPMNSDICPKRDCQIGDLVSLWNLSFPTIYEEKSCIQISNKYIVSIGAHFTHQKALLSKQEKIDYFTATEICNLLSFLFDTVISLDFAFKSEDTNNIFAEMSEYFQVIGHEHIGSSSFMSIERHLSSANDHITDLNDGYMRYLPIVPEQGKFLSCDLPTDKRLINALFTYRQALLSVEPSGAILNYWRVLESVGDIKQIIKLKKEEITLLDELFCTQMQPVIAFSVGSFIENEEFDLVLKYKNYIKIHYSELLEKHKSNKELIMFLYGSRRCPSAHADTNILKIDDKTQLSSLYKDALLLKLLARLAIQKFYSQNT